MSIFEALSRIDLLGIPIILNFSKSKKVRSNFGGLWTLAFLAFVLWTLYINGNELWEKKKPTVNQGVVYDRVARPLEFDSNTLPMMVFIQISDDESGIEDAEDEAAAAENVECDFSFLLTTSASDNGITGDWQDMEPCTTDHFAEFVKNGGIIDSDTADRITYSYCLPTKSYGLVYGFSLSVLCSDQTGIADFFDENPTIELYYPKYGLSLQNYTYPLQPYLFNYEIAMKEGTTTYSYWDINYLNITTDHGWLTTSDKTNNYVQVAPALNPEVTLTGNNQNVFVFRISQEESFYTREYTKVQNVLAAVGGLAGSVLAILLILITPFARLKLSETFVNEMFDLRTELEQKTPDEKQKSKKSKNKSKAPKTTKLSNHASFDANGTRKDNLQALEMVERNIKDPYKEDIPIKSQSPEIPGDESPLVGSGRMGDPQPSQSERVIIPQTVKKSFSEFDEVPIQAPVQTIRPNNIKGGFGLKNPFNGDRNKEIAIEVQDLENPEIIPEAPPIEVPSKTERCSEEEQMREKGDIEAQQDYGRNANQIIAEDQTRKLGEKGDIEAQQDYDRNANEVIIEEQGRKPQKDGIFKQLTFSSNLKKIKPKFINISFLEYLSSFVYKSESTKVKMKIINEGLDMLDSRLDVFNLMKKLRDVDKIKGLILNKEQLFLFDRLSRPDITDRSSHWYQEDYLSYYEVFKSADQLEELKMQARIKETQKVIQDKSQKSKIDKRILELL